MKQIAVACQGGSLHAAFTAGALKTILQGSENNSYTIIGLSGTSAGALCAVTCWCGLLNGGPAAAAQKLDAVWQDFGARTPAEQFFNNWLVAALRLQGQGVVPEIKFSPYHPLFPLWLKQLEMTGVRQEFLDYATLLNKHIQLAGIDQPMSKPRLLIGAVNVLSGAFKVFDSNESEISIDAVRASGAIPGLGVRAVKIGNEIYWDGLYSQNPPIRNFVADPDHAADKPDEIWIIQINPKERATEPRSVEEIQDRDNELAANLALEQEKKSIEDVNQWVEAGYLPKDRYRLVNMRTITMSPQLSQRLDFASKLDRSPAFVQELMKDGEMQARLFLDNWTP